MFVPKGPFNNNPALVQIIAWRRPGDKPLPKQMLTQIYDVIWSHQAKMGQLKIVWSLLSICRPYANIKIFILDNSLDYWSMGLLMIN